MLRVKSENLTHIYLSHIYLTHIYLTRINNTHINYTNINLTHINSTHINLQHIFLYILCIPAPNTLICTPVCRYCRKSKTYSYRADIARFKGCSLILFRLLITTWSFCSSIISFPPLVTRPYS